MKRYSLSAIGRDRPGIVATLTGALFDHNCNVEDSSMTILQHEFAVILIMSAPDDLDMDALRVNLNGVEKLLKLTIHVKENDETRLEDIPGSNHIVTVSGFDKLGIVYKTSDFLAKWGINITDLETKILPGEEKNIYLLLMEAFFPANVDYKALEDSLNILADSLGVSIAVKPIETYDSL